MAKEEVNTEFLFVEVSQNDRTLDDKVYLYLEHFNSGDIEVYISVEDFKRIVKAFLRLDEQLVT